MATEHPARLAAQGSMRAVLAKDKQAWLNLFADEAVVEDPIGVSPLDPAGKGHRGKAAISAFWDANIGPNKTEFDIRHSYAAGNEVANVGQIITTMPDGKKTHVDIVITYKVNDQGKLVALRAYWEFEKAFGPLMAAAK